MHVFLAIALLIGLLAVHLALAFWGPTLPTVKSSAPKGYATTMEPNNTDDLPTAVDALAAVDPTDFSADPAFLDMLDAAFDIAKQYDVSVEFVVASLEGAVSHGDQR